MSTVAEIEYAIEKLPPQQLLEVAVWIGKQIEAREDEADIKAAEAALAEGGEPIEWEEIKRQLGLV
jgi:hypothetical protein